MRALREQRHRGQQARDLAVRRRMAEHRQGEGGLGDEDVARHRFEAAAGGIGLALVVAADHGAAAAPGRSPPARCPARARRAAAADHPVDAAGPRPSRAAAAPPRPPGAEARVHQRQRLAAGEHVAMARPGVVGMAWVITARSTARNGSMKKPPGSQYRPCGNSFSQVAGCGDMVRPACDRHGMNAKPKRQAASLGPAPAISPIMRPNAGGLSIMADAKIIAHRKLGAGGLSVAAIGLGGMSLSGIYGAADDKGVRGPHPTRDRPSARIIRFPPTCMAGATTSRCSAKR